MIKFDSPYWPKHIIQGVGIWEDACEMLNKFDGKKCLFFTDANLLKLDLTQKIIKKIKGLGYDVHVYSDIEENPTDQSVIQTVNYMKYIEPNFLIYYGGGSVIDLGKASNVLYTHGGNIYEYEDLNGGIDKIKNKTLPALAIPTTAGSGSEVSAVSVITDTRRNLKIALISPYIVPTLSVLDPLTTLSMPANITAYTGMDALSHTIEAYVSSVPFEPCRGIALKGMELIYNSLKKVVFNGNDIQARTDMLVGSACGSMAFNNNFLGATHGCAHQLSSVAGIPHGLANAIMLTPIMRWNISSNIKAYLDIAKCFGIDITKTNLTPYDIANQCVDLIGQLSQDIGIPSSLSSIGVKEDMIDELVDKAYIDHNMLTNPRKSHECPDRISKNTIKSFYMEVL